MIFRSLVAAPPVQDLLVSAKDLFGAANRNQQTRAFRQRAFWPPTRDDVMTAFVGQAAIWAAKNKSLARNNKTRTRGQSDEEAGPFYDKSGRFTGSSTTTNNRDGSTSNVWMV
jgi:hypothetical protein